MSGLTALAINSPHKRSAKIKVALADFDSGVGFLPDLAERANKAQGYYDFDVVFLPFPTGVVVLNGDFANCYPEVPRLSVPVLADVLVHVPNQLKVDVLCCLTRNLLDNGTNSDLFTAAHPTNPKIRFVSTYGVRGYAKDAGVSFAKATFSLCITELLQADVRWGLHEHPETVGCVLDYCDNRDDLVVSLRLMKFEHAPCRDKVKDSKMLAAIDKLLALELDDEQAAAEAR